MEQVIDVYVRKILLAAAAVAISRLPLFFFGDDGTFTNMVHALFSTVISFQNYLKFQIEVGITQSLCKKNR